ncbi:lytic murein transglycosylase [Marinimicrobium sp. ABcell2]|uniref:lytic murein transglycosylase n=1 Tax=Marinimicrobium sp. ABcell2 TaxID=3069751 RepID=UPI0027B4A4EE|nr:lytic murein transglycosylase [Marinimicrobium sp. ABcell2]MDQ2075124.1 lytic murein transglycosylase [Marinimicrobium sp. ABcell2]
MTIRKSLLAGLGLSLSAVFPSAQAMPAEEFAQCIANIDALARTEGISSNTLEQSLANVKFSERVIELDRRQPEFTTTFADYFGRRVNEQRVNQGRALLKEHGALLERVSKQYGVPAPYLVAFWGLETNFGSFFGRMSVLDSLATLACDPRRSTYFTRELISALRIIDEGAITAERMEGSWAGAMGHVQFMPSVFLRYAVDYDESGRRDLWNSLPDAMASAANFLQHLGWDENTRWGREVKLPNNFPFMEAGLDTRKPLSEWAKLGVRRADGAPLPAADLQASLLIPAGHEGPAFLVYSNFRVIMGWNQSEFYALSVGLLADRIAGAGPLVQSPPADAPRLSRDQVVALQETLNGKGFDSGTVDGILGPATRRALRSFQHSQDMVADGFPGLEVLKKLGINLSD